MGRSIAELIRQVEAAGNQVEFAGPQREGVIDEVASALGVEFPPSFREFLREYGGGGIVGEWISGIYDNQPILRNAGTVYGDTMRCREQYRMPHPFVVVYNCDDEVVWCLDTSQVGGERECPVVSVDVHGKGKPVRISSCFSSFFRDYLVGHAIAT